MSPNSTIFQKKTFLILPYHQQTGLFHRYLSHSGPMIISVQTWGDTRGASAPRQTGMGPHCFFEVLVCGTPVETAQSE